MNRQERITKCDTLLHNLALAKLKPHINMASLLRIERSVRELRANLLNLSDDCDDCCDYLDCDCNGDEGGAPAFGDSWPHSYKHENHIIKTHYWPSYGSHRFSVAVIINNSNGRALKRIASAKRFATEDDAWKHGRQLCRGTGLWARDGVQNQPAPWGSFKELYQ